MKTFNIQLVSYPSYLPYEFGDADYYQAQEEAEYFNEDHPGFEVTADDYETDWDELEKDFHEAFVEAYQKKMPEIVLNMHANGIDKPREYRCFHRGDYAYADVDLEDNWLEVMKAWIQDHYEWFRIRVDEDWTSRDGFWSFLENTVDGWLEYLDKEDTRYIGQMLWYMAAYENKNIRDEIQCWALEDVWIGSYLHLSEEKQKELEEFEAAAESAE